MNTITKINRLALSVFLIAILVVPAAAQDSEFQQLSNVRFASNDAVDELVDRTESFESLVSEIKILENIPVQAPVLSAVQWDDYADRLEAALDTDHKGLNHAALRLVIAYGDNLSLDEDAVFDVMRIYRDDDSERARRMAVVALAEMDSDWAISFLERSSRFEKSETVKQTILAVLELHNRDSQPL